MLLCFELCFDESLVRNNNVAILLIDLYNLEFHCLAYENIVVANGLHVDLRTGQEGFYAKYIDDHAALCATLDETFDNFLAFKSLIDTLP